MQNKLRETVKKISSKDTEVYVDELVTSVTNDFNKRRQERVKLERTWELNMNFMYGNQYCEIDSRGELTSEDKTFYWQNRGVYNHIASIIETRLAKFSKVKPILAVRPKSDDDTDVKSSLLAEKLIESSFQKVDIESVVRQVTAWSEICGTAFYKVLWDSNGGNLVGEMNGEKVYEGDVNIICVSPFEIFPDNLNIEKLQDCHSIIHAKAMSVEDVYEKYGVALEGKEIDVYSLDAVGLNANSSKKDSKRTISNSAIVIEKYERPTSKYPNGRLITVSNDKLLYYGELPYKLLANDNCGFPFIKQESSVVTGQFFGASTIERLIPVQRSYNAVKNRKHEFMNRLSMGVMTVEDGSVDTEDLETDGLSPGKILVYRQGAKAPEIMNETVLSPDFSLEEEKLLNEFVIVSGVGDVASSVQNPSVSSGTALEILIEQQNERLTMPAEIIRRCYVEIAKMFLRLYSQFTSSIRAIRCADSFNKTRVYYADKNSTSSDDVYLESENELSYTQSQRKSTIFKMYESGLLSDEDGQIRPSLKEKVLNMLGYKDLDYQKGLSRLHEEKAQNENNKIRDYGLSVDEVDNHSIHIEEHERYFLSEYRDLSDEQKQRLFSHIDEHKQKQLKEKQKQEQINQ